MFFLAKEIIEILLKKIVNNRDWKRKKFFIVAKKFRLLYKKL